MSTNILKIVSDICPYIGLGIPLCGLSNLCVMFLGVPPVISTLGIPQGTYFGGGEVKSLHLAKKPPIWEPPKSTKAGAPTVFLPAHLGNTESLFPHLRCGWISAWRPTLGLEAGPRPGGRPYAWRPTLDLEADPRPGTRP